MKIIFSLLFCCLLNSLYGQETNAGKKLYAKSILNQKAPELIVQEWLTKAPDTRGKFVLIDFSATWCHACRETMPELNLFQKEFADKLVVIFITNETPEKVRSAKNFLVEIPTAVDTLKRTFKLLEIKGIPHNLLIDPKGYVRWEGFPSTKDFELTEDILVDLFNKYGHYSVAKEKQMKKVLNETSVDGPVLSVTSKDYAAVKNQDQIEKGKSLGKEISEYDGNGQLRKQSYYKAGDTLVSKSSATFNKEGNVTERICYSPDEKILTRLAYSYDPTGNLTTETIYDSKGKPDCQTDYSYDRAGNIVKEKLTDGEGKIVYQSLYRYTLKNKLAEKITSDAAGKQCSAYTAIYDKHNRKIQDNVLASDGSLLNRYVASYDKNGNHLQDKVFNAAETLSSVYTYTYDGLHHLSEERTDYPDGTLVLKYDYKYDVSGNLTQTDRYHKGGELYLHSNYDSTADEQEVVWDYYNQGKRDARFINEYANKDDKGNWLKRINYVNGNPTLYTIREIQYQDKIAKKDE